MSKPQLGYWKIRGLAEPARMMLHYLNVDFEDVQYEQGDAPDFSREPWLSVKFTLGIPFPNLPYFIDGDFKISETIGILLYIAEKYGPQLLGSSVESKAVATMCYGVVSGIKAAFTTACYNPNYANLIQNVPDQQRDNATKLANYLQGKRFLMGDDVCYADFVLYETIELVNATSPGFLDGVSPVFAQFQENFRQLDRMSEFLSRPRLPFNNKIAQFK